MSVIRLAAIVWRVLRARSPAFVSPPTDVTDILEFGSFSPNISRARQERSVCERNRCCATCGRFVTYARQECNKVYCANCKQNKDIGHLCYMKPLKDVLPDTSDKVLCIFYDFETTQNTKNSDKATLYVPDLVCVQ